VRGFVDERTCVCGCVCLTVCMCPCVCVLWDGPEPCRCVCLQRGVLHVRVNACCFVPVLCVYACVCVCVSVCVCVLRFQQCLKVVFMSFRETYQGIEGRMTADKLKVCVWTGLMRVWTV